MDSASLDLCGRIAACPGWLEHRPAFEGHLWRYPLPGGGAYWLPRLDTDPAIGILLGILIDASGGDARVALEAVLAHLGRGPGEYGRAVARALLAAWGEVPADLMIEITRATCAPERDRTARAFASGAFVGVVDLDDPDLASRLLMAGPPATLDCYPRDGGRLWSASWTPPGGPGVTVTHARRGAAVALAWLELRRAPPAPDPALATLHTRRRPRGPRAPAATGG